MKTNFDELEKKLIELKKAGKLKWMKSDEIAKALGTNITYLYEKPKLRKHVYCRRRRLSNEDMEQIKQRILAGEKVTKIAEELGVASANIYRRVSVKKTISEAKNESRTKI